MPDEQADMGVTGPRRAPRVPRGGNSADAQTFRFATAPRGRRRSGRGAAPLLARVGARCLPGRRDRWWGPAQRTRSVLGALILAVPHPTVTHGDQFRDDADGDLFGGDGAQVEADGGVHAAQHVRGHAFLHEGIEHPGHFARDPMRPT